jgi:hypothetical protein
MVIKSWLVPVGAIVRTGAVWDKAVSVAATMVQIPMMAVQCLLIVFMGFSFSVVGLQGVRMVCRRQYGEYRLIFQKIDLKQTTLLKTSPPLSK